MLLKSWSLLGRLGDCFREKAMFRLLERDHCTLGLSVLTLVLDAHTPVFQISFVGAFPSGARGCRAHSQ